MEYYKEHKGTMVKCFLNYTEKQRGAVKWLDLLCANKCEQLNIQLACLTLPIISLSFTSLLKTQPLKSMTWNNPNVKMLPKANHFLFSGRKVERGWEMSISEYSSNKKLSSLKSIEFKCVCFTWNSLVHIL